MSVDDIVKELRQIYYLRCDVSQMLDRAITLFDQKKVNVSDQIKVLQRLGDFAKEIEN